MGGNGPLVVLEDADLDAAADAAIDAAFLCAGQSCTAGEHFLVHEKVHDDFLEKLLAARERRVHLGDPFDAEATMGPLNNEATAQKMDEHVADALERGARLLSGGDRAEGFPTSLYYEADRSRRRHPRYAGRAGRNLRPRRADHHHSERRRGRSDD